MHGEAIPVTRLAALLLLAALPALGQELVTVVEPSERTTARVILLVDVSGSMRGPPLEAAIAAALSIARAGGDQLELAAYAFAGGCCRWPAPRVEGETAPEGWASFPNEPALAHLLGWLRTPVLSDTNTTEISGALRAALAEPRDKLSVIVVSDGLLNDAAKALEILAEGQARREELGLGKAVVACWTIGAEAPVLNELGREGRGGCWREAQPPPPPPLPSGRPGVQGSAR